MDIEAGIIDQRVRKLVEVHGAALAPRNAPDGELHRKSNAFCLLCAMTLLDLDEQEALRCLTDGGRDGGVDALHIGDIVDDEFIVTLFQAKYAQDLDGRKNFPGGELPKIIQTVQTIFDPDAPLHEMDDIRFPVEDIRSRLRDGIFPRVRVVLCNNGKGLHKDGHARIDGSGLPRDQVSWEHLGPARLIALSRKEQPFSVTLAFEGEAIVEDMNFRRVLVGRLPVAQIAQLMSERGDMLLERNVRRYLGIHNPVNRDIEQTLRSEESRPNFYFLNNGVTMLCRKFSVNELQRRNYQVRIEDLRIINGAQTCRTIEEVHRDLPAADFSRASVLVRLYQIDEQDSDFPNRVTYATNHQTPVELHDLRANDEIQRKLALDLKELGYDYRTKRDSSPVTDKTITITEAAEALACRAHLPHIARFSRQKLFGPYYGQVFPRTVVGAEVVFATHVLRCMRERCAGESRPEYRFFATYASHYLAAWMRDFPFGASKTEIDHRTLTSILQRWLAEGDARYDDHIEILAQVLGLIGISETSPLQRVAAQFRRSDLLNYSFSFAPKMRLP